MQENTEMEYDQEIFEVKACDVPTLGAIIWILRFMEIISILCIPALIILFSVGKADTEIGSLKGTSLIVCTALVGIVLLGIYEYCIRGYKKIHASWARFTPSGIEHHNGSDTVQLTRIQLGNGNCKIKTAENKLILTPLNGKKRTIFGNNDELQEALEYMKHHYGINI